MIKVYAQDILKELLINVTFLYDLDTKWFTHQTKGVSKNEIVKTFRKIVEFGNNIKFVKEF